MTQITKIEKELEPLRRKLTTHRLYELLTDIEDIRLFMERHVYAVWDFMSLLKALQQQLTCTTLPWKPAPEPSLARFINEIVLEEESDVNEKGVATSHFEMYLDAMKEVQADTSKVHALLQQIHSLEDMEAAIQPLDAAEREFLRYTFQIIASGQPHKIAAAFTFGREDLIPDIFIEIIRQSEKENNSSLYPKLAWYLNRHIELDGDEHGPLALRMIRELCGEDDQKWSEVLTVSKAALERRIGLWDGIAAAIEAEKALA
jgi:hypothetical protein